MITLDLTPGREFQSFVNRLLVPSVDPRGFALSLREMGAQVCRSKNPLCDTCPIFLRCIQAIDTPILDP